MPGCQRESIGAVGLCAKHKRLQADLPWAPIWPWKRCRASVEPNPTGYWGRCDLQARHDGDHALERGMDTPRWSTRFSQ